MSNELKIKIITFRSDAQEIDKASMINLTVEARAAGWQCADSIGQRRLVPMKIWVITTQTEGWLDE